jgi:hypothetical protein
MFPFFIFLFCFRVQSEIITDRKEQGDATVAGILRETMPAPQVWQDYSVRRGMIQCLNTSRLVDYTFQHRLCGGFTPYESLRLFYGPIAYDATAR